MRYSDDSGGTWDDWSNANYDGGFRIYGPSAPVPSAENNMITNRRLVAAANDKIWYENI